MFALASTHVSVTGGRRLLGVLAFFNWEIAVELQPNTIIAGGKDTHYECSEQHPYQRFFGEEDGKFVCYCTI